MEGGNVQRTMFTEIPMTLIDRKIKENTIKNKEES
jgi:hypothetical protein